MHGTYQRQLLQIAAAAIFIGGATAQALAAQPEAAVQRAPEQRLRLTEQQRQTIENAAAIARSRNFDAASHDIIVNTRPVGLGAECTEDQFVKASWRTGRATGGEGLLSRHVDCRISRTVRMDFQALVVKSKEGNYRFARKNDKHPTELLTFGSGIIETRLQSYGPPGGLNKRHKLETRVVEFREKPSYKGPRPTGLTIRPTVGCRAATTPDQVDSCTVPTVARLGYFKVALNGPWVVKRFNAQFNWTKVQPEPNIDFADFQVFIGNFFYAATGNAAPEEGTGIMYDTDMIGWPLIRCDRGMAVQGGGGCVHPEAASIVTLSKAASSPVVESAHHIEEALEGWSPGMSDHAPGKFRLRPGTRAIADFGTPLTRKALLIGKEITQDGFSYNRHAACGDHGASIIRTWPNASGSCATQKCSCDEFPYAKTWEGGHFARGTTSAKQIIAVDNSLSGTLMAQQLHWDHVLDFSTPSDPGHGGEFWVQVLD